MNTLQKLLAEFESSHYSRTKAHELLLEHARELQARYYPLSAVFERIKDEGGFQSSLGPELLGKLEKLDPEIFDPAEKIQLFTLPCGHQYFDRNHHERFGIWKTTHFYERHLLAALLNRIKARGWDWVRDSIPDGDHCVVFGPVGQPDICSGASGATLTEALARAYIKALETHHGGPQ